MFGIFCRNNFFFEKKKKGSVLEFVIFLVFILKIISAR